MSSSTPRRAFPHLTSSENFTPLIVLFKSLLVAYNDIFPTLSYHDFFSLSQVNNLKWDPIVKKMIEKYTHLKNIEDPKAVLVVS